jgi:hypothetical protein
MYMDPKRAARLLALIGAALLITVLAMRGLSLAATTVLMRVNAPDVKQPTVFPIQGHYILSADGRLVFFEQQSDLSGETSWFSMPIEGGAIRPAEAPEADIRPFMVRDGQLFVMVGEGYSLTTGSPRESRVASYALSPDGKAIAFAAYGEGPQWALYILDTELHLSWLGDEDILMDLAWSPDGKSLLYVAPREGVDQILKVDSTGLNLQQLTHDVTRKSSPRWSPDGQQIAYLATTHVEKYSAGKATATPAWPAPRLPATGKTDVYVMQADGSDPRQLTVDGTGKAALAWGVSQSGFEILYSVQTAPGIRNAILYGVQPQSRQVRQVYPPYTLGALSCPMQQETRGEGKITVTIINHSRQPAEIPLLVRSGTSRFSITGRRNTGTVQAVTVLAPASGSKTTELSLQTAAGLFTHVSALINQGNPFPMDEQSCVIANTYGALPNLTLLGLMLPLTAAGLALCIPWLRHQRSRWLWALWAAVPLAVSILIGIEIWSVWGP